MLMEEGRRQMMMRSSSNEHRLLAIALTLVAVISPLYIDRRGRRKAGTGRQSDPDEETLTGGPFSSFLLLLLVVVSVAAAAATATATRGAIRLASYKRPGAIALAVLAVLSPLYIDRDGEEEEENEGPALGNGFVQLFVLLGLVVAIALSCYFDRSFTRFDPYWIHRVGGSSTGILVLLLVLAFVLKFKAY